jgi:hypothetical protein
MKSDAPSLISGPYWERNSRRCIGRNAAFIKPGDAPTTFNDRLTSQKRDQTNGLLSHPELKDAFMTAADPTYHANGTCRHLWAAVIQQALDDLSQCSHTGLEFADAKSFLIGRGQWAESRQYICDLLGSDPSTLVKCGLNILKSRPECSEDYAAAERAWSKPSKMPRKPGEKLPPPRRSARNEFHPSQLNAPSSTEPKRPQLPVASMQPTAPHALVAMSIKQVDTFKDMAGEKHKYARRVPERRYFPVQEKWFRAA